MKDLFSAQAVDYSRYRPRYPEKLFEYLARESPKRELAWDVGTGNGQAAIALARHFRRVVATDPSEKQLASAMPQEGVEYLLAPAERAPLKNGIVDLITVAQAFHWFDQNAFFAEVKRVAAPGAFLAIWCYGLAQVSEEIDAVVDQLYRGILEPYWEKERKLVEEGYRNVNVPFSEISVPKFEMSFDWSSDDMLGYLGTWSALQTYVKKNGRDPRQDIADELRRAWGEGTRKIIWPLSLRGFRVSGS